MSPVLPRKNIFPEKMRHCQTAFFLHQIGSLRHVPSTAIMFRSCKKHPLPDGKGCPCEKVYKEEVGICPHGTDRFHFGDVKL